MKHYSLKALTWINGTDKNNIPYSEANAERWFDGEPVTFRRYSRNYVIAYHGNSGVDEWTSDGNGDGKIEIGVTVIVKRIPIEDFEQGTGNWIKTLRPLIFDIANEYGDEYVDYDPDDMLY